MILAIPSVGPEGKRVPCWSENYKTIAIKFKIMFKYVLQTLIDFAVKFNQMLGLIINGTKFELNK